MPGLFSSVKSLIGELSTKPKSGLFDDVDSLISEIPGDDPQNNVPRGTLNPQDSLTPVQKILTNPVVDKILSGVSKVIPPEPMPIEQAPMIGPIPPNRTRNPITSLLEGLYANNPIVGMQRNLRQLEGMKNEPGTVSTPENLLDIADRQAMREGAPQNVSVGEIVEPSLMAALPAMAGMSPLSIAGMMGALTAKKKFISEPIREKIPEGTGKSAFDIADLLTDVPFAMFGANPAEAVAAHKASKILDVKSLIEKDLPNIKAQVKKDNPNISDDALNQITPDTVIEGAKTNKSIGDYLNRVQSKVSPFSKMGLSTEDVSLPEGVKPPENKPTFYSKLEQVTNEKVPNNASPEQILKTLAAAGVKQEEIDWYDLDNFLAGKQKVSKKELIDHVKQNQVEIKEVEKIGSNLEEVSSNYNDYVNELKKKYDPSGRMNMSSLVDSGVISKEDMDQLNNLDDAVKNARSKGSKFQSYQLPGGENYRELLLTLPSSNPEMDAMVRERKALAKIDASRSLSPQEEARYAELSHKTKDYLNKGDFKSSHFDEPNILAHVRMNDRTDADGKKVLFIEEVQSDWHQKGRKQGYQKNIDDNNLEARWHEPIVPEGHDKNNYPGYWEVFDKSTGKLIIRNPGGKTAEEAVKIAAKEWKPLVEQAGVPDAPFKKTWHELAMKRMLRYAAENGYDKLSWTTGEQQAERYDLSKQVNAIDYVKLDGDNYRVGAHGRDGEGIDRTMKSSELDDFVGKEIANKIRSGEGKGLDNSQFTRLTGLDLKVGGEGMKGFYDTILPSFMNKYAKKWGGRVTQTDIRANQTVPKEHKEFGYEDRLPKVETRVHSIDITPSMKKSVLEEGQPLFKEQKSWDEMKHGRKEEEIAIDTELGKKLIKEFAPGLDLEIAPGIINYKGIKALGMYLNGKATVAKGAYINAYIHEMGHGVLDLHVSKADRAALIGYAKLRFAKLDDVAAEEAVMRGLEDYASWKLGYKRKPTWQNKAMDIFNKIYDAIKKFLKIPKSRLEKFYEEVFKKGKESKNKPSGEQAKFKEAEWSDNPEKMPIEKTNEPINIKDKAEMELEIMAAGNVHPLEVAMKSVGKISPYAGGRESEELKEIPARFKDAKNGRPLDERRQELENNHGIVFASDSELAQALKSLGGQQMRFGLSDDVQTYLKNQKNVEAIDKNLSQTLKPGAVKRIIHSYVGVKKVKTDIIIQTTEQQVLKHMLKVRQKASKEGYVSGLKEGKQEIRSKVKERAEAKRKAREEAQRFTPEERKALYQRAYSKGLIIKLDSGKTKDRLQGLLRYYKDASFGELKSYISELQGAVGNPPLVLKLFGDAAADTEVIKLINEASKDWRDINTTEIRTLDMQRIIEKVTGLDAWDNNILNDNFYDVLAGADAMRFDRMNDELKELYSNSHGILKDTKASAELMRKFEAGETLSASDQKVVDFLRSKYNLLIKEANEVRAKLGKKPIPYRQNYMTHIRDQNLLVDFFKGDIAKSQEISNEQLDAIRKGDFTKGNMKFNQFAQKRLGKKTKNDAIGNYEKYLETLLYEIYISPAVTHARRFTDYALLKFPNAYEATTMLLNEMAGKPSALDKLLKPFVSNKVVKWIRQRIASNALIGNVSFNLLNIANLSTSSGELGTYALKGANSFLGNKELRDLAFKHSSVLKSRRGQFDADVKAISVFNPASFEKLTVTEKAKVGAQQLKYLTEGITRTIEYFNVGSTWVGAYLKATDVFKFPQEKAFKYADTIAKRTQVGYRPYELPAAMRSDTGKLFLQFQSWTFNAMNHLIYDLKLGNIANTARNKISKDNLPTKVEYGKFIVLLGVLMLVNELYKRQGWREPTSVASAIPRASFPAGRVFSDFGKATGADNLVKTIMGQRPTRHDKETVEKAQKRFLASNIMPFGGVQISRFLEGNVLPDTSKFDKTEVVDLYEKALRTEDNKKFKEILKKANDIAGKKNILIEDAMDSAERRIRDEITDLYEEAIIKNDKKLIEKGDKIAQIAGFDEDAIYKLGQAAERRITKREKKEVDLEYQQEEYLKENPPLANRLKDLISSL